MYSPPEPLRILRSIIDRSQDDQIFVLSLDTSEDEKHYEMVVVKDREGTEAQYVHYLTGPHARIENMAINKPMSCTIIIADDSTQDDPAAHLFYLLAQLPRGASIIFLVPKGRGVRCHMDEQQRPTSKAVSMVSGCGTQGLGIPNMRPIMDEVIAGLHTCD